RTVPQTDPAGRRAALLLGLIQQRRGDLEESLASLARYVFSFADRGGMVYARGYLFWEMGNRDLAIHVWNEGLSDLGGYPDPLEKMAGHFRDQGNAPREFAVRNALREAAPDNLANRVRLGDLLMAAGRQDEALREWEEITARKPGDFELLRRLGKAYLAQGDVERGVEALRRASRVKELEPELTELLGRNLVALGHNDKALEIYWRLHALQPEHPELRRVLPDLVLKTPAHQEVRLAAARLAERTSRPELAIDILEDLLRVWPDDQEARRLLTALFLNRGEAEEAERVALAGGEGGTAFDIRQLRLLWDAQLRLANKKGLIVTLGKILEIDPGEEPARRQQGLLLAEFGRFEEALPLLSASHRAGAGDPEILWQLGRAQWATGHGNEAAAVLKRLTKREPGHEGANRTLIEIYREGKRWQELAVKLEAWVAARPDDNQARIDLITAYLKRFKVEEARPHYKALKAISPLRARRLARYFR
ncbi:MAG: tetratricopeptide repeat protein, partial [SAR324 cluster bacterium]|nr:tetratricopeptide repeat protein [SAR324 cluster bacterium]